MPISHKVFVTDFDHTVFDTDAFFFRDVKNAFIHAGLPVHAWESSAERAIARGYTLEVHLEEMVREGSGFTLADGERIIRTEFGDLCRYVYPDVVPALRQLCSIGYELALASFGNPDWQRYKLSASGLGEWFRSENVLLQTKENSKAGAILERFGDDVRIVFVDNKAPEVDSARASLPHAITFHIDRSSTADASGHYSEGAALAMRKAVAEHRQCTNFGDIVDSLSKEEVPHAVRY